MYKPEGIYVAMLTPFTDQGTINEEVLRRMVEFLIESGVHGLFPVSSVGESIHLTREEKILMMEIIVDQNRNRVQVIPGASSSYPAESILLARKANELGCDGVVIAAPYFFHVSQESIQAYFETISDAVDIPIIIYNSPLFTQPLSYDLVKRLAKKDNIVAMKDSSGSMVDFLHFMDTTRISGGEINILTGREESLFPCLMVGGMGCMTATAGILPEIMIAIYKTWQAKNYDKARELQFTILSLVRAMFELPLPLGFKVAMEMRGFKMGPPKQPLYDALSDTYDSLKADIEEKMAALLDNLREIATKSHTGN